MTRPHTRYVELAALLRQRLVELDLTQAKARELLARRKAWVSENTISLWMTGERRPSIDNLEALLDVLAVHGRAREAAYSAAARGVQADSGAS